MLTRNIRLLSSKMHCLRTVPAGCCSDVLLLTSQREKYHISVSVMGVFLVIIVLSRALVIFVDIKVDALEKIINKRNLNRNQDQVKGK